MIRKKAEIFLYVLCFFVGELLKKKKKYDILIIGYFTLL